MKAMILAAGLGQRMRPLTNDLPKPLLTVNDKPLIVYHIEALKRAGIKEIVINTAYLGEKIEAFLGGGEQWGVEINYSREGEPMNTGAGIANALPLLGNAPFILTNSDVWTDYDYSALLQRDVDLAHLVLVDNPAHNPAGDFSLTRQQRVLNERGSNAGIGLTYAGISVLSPELFAFCPRGGFPLRQPLQQAMAENRVTGEHFTGCWMDIGTPQRLEEINRQFTG